MPAFEAHIYRHAQSASNAGERTEHPATIPLSAKGFEQADALAAALAREAASPSNRLIASPFLRARQTIAPVADRLEARRVEIWDIEEFTYLEPSTCVGTSWVERKPRIDAYWAALDPTARDGPNAESFVDLLERAAAFLKRLPEVEVEVVVVSHGQFMQAVQLIAESPTLSPKDAMAELRDRQAARPFDNCERLRLISSVANGRLTARRD